MKIIILSLLSLSFVACSGVRQKTTSKTVNKRELASSFQDKFILTQPSFFFQGIEKETLVTCGKRNSVLAIVDPCNINPHLPVCKPTRIVNLDKGESVIIRPGERVFVECID